MDSAEPGPEAAAPKEHAKGLPVRRVCWNPDLFFVDPESGAGDQSRLLAIEECNKALVGDLLDQREGVDDDR